VKENKEYVEKPPDHFTDYCIKSDKKSNYNKGRKGVSRVKSSPTLLFTWDRPRQNSFLLYSDRL